ncbi:MAG: malectin domain-containing carbohydrate-binding protein, partial [Verrucomicrobiota bacterium]
VRRTGPLPGSTEYAGQFAASPDALVRFPLGVLWFDDTLAHFKRSPQPVFDRDTMISRPKNWDVPRFEKSNKIDYPLLPFVLSDIYTGRVLAETERPKLRTALKPSSPSALEPSQYRRPGQPFSTRPGPVETGNRINPLTGVSEPRTFPKTYGCDGGVDYGLLYTLRSGTAAYYDQRIESGTVYLSGPRSGCTNSIIPSGGLLNVPYYYEGCTCSYPLPMAMALVSMPDRHEQWSSWGKSRIQPGTIQRIGLNFGAPGDRMTKDGTLWLDYPSVGGPSPELAIEATPSTRYAYRHSLWMNREDPMPWIGASVAEGLERLVIKDLNPGDYSVRLYFAETTPSGKASGVQTIRLQGNAVLEDFDITREAGEVMKGIVREFENIVVEGSLVLEMSAQKGRTLISGIELMRQ